jgi:hypothetical protein
MIINSAGLIGPQVPHTQSLLDSIYLNGFAFDASETGTGKTYCAASIARETGRPVVVISPKSVIPAWVKILKLFGVVPSVIVNYEKLGRGNTKWMKWKKLQDPTMPWKEKEKREIPDFRFPKQSLIILDEGHKCKGTDTTNSWMMVSLTLQGYTVLVSSATAASSPLEMKAFGFLTKLHNLYDFTDFCRIHGASWVGRWGALNWDAASEEAKKTMVGLNNYLFNEKKCASRMTREDFGDLFPESQIDANAFDLGDTATTQIQKVYDTMEYELDRLEETTENYSEHVFAIIMKARRHAELCKVPLFVEMIEDLYDEGKSVAVFVNFTDTAIAISNRLSKIKKLKNMIGFVIGGQDEEQRQNEIDSFQSDKKRIIICNIAAGGVGISLHDLNGNFPRTSIISPTWSAQNMVQALGRIWRQGGMSKSYQRIVYAAGCIEEQICSRVSFKVNNINMLNDGDLAEHILWLETQ